MVYFFQVLYFIHKGLPPWNHGARNQLRYHWPSQWGRRGAGILWSQASLHTWASCFYRWEAEALRGSGQSLQVQSIPSVVSPRVSGSSHAGHWRLALLTLVSAWPFSPLLFQDFSDNTGGWGGYCPVTRAWAPPGFNLSNFVHVRFCSKKFSTAYRKKKVWKYSYLFHVLLFFFLASKLVSAKT